MTGEQALVLVFLGASFAAGWLAASRASDGRETASRQQLHDLLRECEDALACALGALTAMHTRGSAGPADQRQPLPSPLQGAVAELGGLGDRLNRSVGDLNPAAVEFEQARAAIQWLMRDVSRGPDALSPEARAVERAARDAFTRFRRLASAIKTALPTNTD